MDESGGKSEVARVLRQIDLEQEAADRALRHDFINARMQRSGEYLLQLIDQGRHEEALALMNSDDWGGECQQPRKKRRRANKQKNSETRP